MACCKEIPRNQTELFEGMPDSALMCLARMAYQLTCAAEHFYTGRERIAWEHLHDETCAIFATKARKALTGQPLEEDQLFSSMLHSLVRAV